MSSYSSNRINVPEARQALSNMKFEIANEMGINLTTALDSVATFSSKVGHVTV